MKIEAVPQFNNDGSPKMWNGKPSTRMVITPASEIPLLQRWVPICEKRFPFEITTSLLLTPDQPGVPIPRKLQEQHRPFFPEGRRIGREAGVALAQWSMGGAARPAPRAGGTRDAPATAAAIELEIGLAKSLDDLRGIWRQHSKSDHWPDLQDAFDKRRAALTPTPETTNNGGDYDGA
jgi:hypothetical protein